MGFTLPSWITGPVAISVACLIALSAYTGAVWHLARKGVADRVQTVTVTKFVKADAKETVRRETVLERVQVRSQSDIKKIDQLATKLAAAQEESRRASLALDNDACLPADSVLRLAAIR